MAEKAILFDSSKCTACKGCQIACKCWNNLPSPTKLNAGEFKGTLQNPPDLQPNTRLIITFDEAEGQQKYFVDWAFGRRSCMHCTDAACVNVCPSGALYHDKETGLVPYDTEKCIGCQYCRTACPYDVPRHTGVGLAGGGIKINKCDGCLSRVQHGQSPACVLTCQPGALKFGDRDEMLALAKERVKVLQDKGYKDAQVYGVTQSGGTHVIHVLKYPLSQYELPENPQESGAEQAAGFMKPLTGVAAAVTVAGLGVSFLTGIGYHRDKMRYDEKNHDVVDVDTGEVIKHIDKEAGER